MKKNQYNSITYEVKAYVAIVALNRPDQLNALNAELLKELGTALDEANEDKEVRVILITGKGRFFCSGLDLKETAETPAVSSFEKSWTDMGPAIFNKVETSEKTVIAAVNGPALGGGCELCLVCDIRVASEAASFGLPEIKIGAMPGAGGTQRLPRIVGIPKAKEMIYTGKTVKAAEAYRINLVNAVTPPEKLMETAMEMAKDLADKSPIALKMAKVAINGGTEGNLRAGLELEARLSKLLFFTDDLKEGMRAFVEKRKPVFTGK